MIDYLEEKLKGELPIDRDDLFELVSSWGRNDDFSTFDEINVEKCKSNECYPLENLDVSEIKDFSLLFGHSLYNGDLSKWDVSNVENMGCMFWSSNFNNDSLNSWNVSNVKDMDSTFWSSIFNGDLSKWDISNVINMQYMFANSIFNSNISNWNMTNIIKCNNAFEDGMFNGDISKWKFNEDVNAFNIFKNKYFYNKYNFNVQQPYNTMTFLKWFEEHKVNIANTNISKDEILDMEDYLSSFNQDKEIVNISN